MPHKNDIPMEPKLEIDGGVNRRDFMKTSALLGGSLLLAGASVPVIAQGQGASKDAGGVFIHHLPENQIYSACQQCNTNCGMKVKLVNGMVAKIDGNPYNPWCMTPQIPEETPIAKAATIEGIPLPQGPGRDPDPLRPISHRQGAQARRQARREQVEEHPLRTGRGGDRQRRRPLRRRQGGRPEGHRRPAGPGRRQGPGRGRRSGRLQKDDDRGVQGQACPEPALPDRPRPPRPGA